MHGNSPIVSHSYNIAEMPKGVRAPPAPAMSNRVVMTDRIIRTEKKMVSVQMALNSDGTSASLVSPSTGTSGSAT